MSILIKEYLNQLLHTYHQLSCTYYEHILILFYKQLHHLQEFHDFLIHGMKYNFEG